MKEISHRFPRTGTLGKKYPRVYHAESIQDMQQGRAELAKGLHRRVGTIPSTSFGSQPGGLYHEDNDAIIYLPEVQHYPAMDPQDDIKRLGGATLHDNLGMRLSDKSDTEGILVWPHKHSFLDFPLPTVFDDIDPFGNFIFNIDKWKAYREVSWRRKVILMAQYSELSRAELKQLKTEGAQFDDMHKPVTELYWLLHIFDFDGVARKMGRERIATSTREPIPVFPPVLA